MTLKVSIMGELVGVVLAELQRHVVHLDDLESSPSLWPPMSCGLPPPVLLEISRRTHRCGQRRNHRWDQRRSHRWDQRRTHRWGQRRIHRWGQRRIHRWGQRRTHRWDQRRTHRWVLGVQGKTTGLVRYNWCQIRSLRWWWLLTKTTTFQLNIVHATNLIDLLVNLMVRTWRKSFFFSSEILHI